MPLEQIRPLLALETRSPKGEQQQPPAIHHHHQHHRRDSQSKREDAHHDDEHLSGQASESRHSPRSPRTPIDGQSISLPPAGSSSLIGPASPSVRSTKSLFNSPYQLPRSDIESPDPGPSTATSSLKRVGGDGDGDGVTRSGSWRGGGISVIGRGRSFDFDNEGAQRASSSPFGFSSLADDSESSAEGSSGSGSSAINLVDVHRRQGSLSRASTIGSYSSYSAAATSLRSLSNRSSTGSNSIPSTSPPLGTSSRKLEDDQRRGSSEHSHNLEPAPQRSDYAELVRRSSGFSSPGLGRVKSIGRGYDGSEQQGAAADRLKRRASKISNLASEAPQEEETPPRSALGIVPSMPSSSSPSPDSTVTQIELAPARTERQAATTPPMQTRSPRLAPASPKPAPALAASQVLSPRSRPSFLGGTSPSQSRQHSPRLGPLSPRMSPTLRGASGQNSPNLGSPLGGGSRWDAQFGYFPAAASASNESSLPAARRHTAGYLRSRSALTQQTSTFGAANVRGTTTNSTSFYGAGQEGGRKAARARARHPSLALLDNAPFSELEARRSQGLRAAAASMMTQPEPVGPASPPAISYDETPDRPLSPIAQASPDAPWSILSLGSAMTGGDNTSLVALPSPALAEGADPQLVAAATSAAVAAEEVRSAAAATASRPPSAGPSPRMSRQHSRPYINPIAVPPLTPRSARDDGAGGTSPSSPSSSSNSATRPQLLHTTSMSSSMTLSPPRLSSPANASMATSSSGGGGGGGSVLGGSSGGGVSGMHPGGIVTHVLRTPTTEEWARFLASQGVEPGQQMARSRTTTGRSLAGFAAQHRASAAAAAAAAAMGASTTDDRGPARSVDSLGMGGGSASSRDVLAAANRSMSSVLDVMEGAEDLDSGSDEEDDDGTQAYGRRRRQRSDSGNSSDSSEEGRMEALRAAISMPPSRRGTPPASVFADGLDEDDERNRNWYGEGARSPGSLNSSFQRAMARQELLAAQQQGQQPQRSSPIIASGRAAPFAAPTASASDPILLQQVQAMYGYIPAPSGRKRRIDDFVIVRDVGRGAYGLVKLIRLKDPVDGQTPVGPEFVVKYIIKSRILADCWRRHRVLGPIPVEIHVMDQLRRLPFVPPAGGPEPWSPQLLWSSPLSPGVDEEAGDVSTPPTPIPPRSTSLSPHLSHSEAADAPTRRRSPSPSAIAQQQQQQQQQQLAPPPLPTYPSNPRSNIPSTHPSLCTMLDFFEDDSFYYLIMPRLSPHGTDLFDYIESHPFGLATREARCLLGQVADGVRFLHAHNIVHRDIKDENVILDGYGRAQLIDFGSAAHVKPGRSFDTFSGTLDYAAAEILRGDKYGGKEQDVWALGVVSYVCLVGDAPFWNGEEAMRGLEEGSRARGALKERCGEELPLPEPQAAPASEEQQGDGSDEGGHAAPPPPPPPPAPSQEEMLQRRDDFAGQVDGGGRLEDAMDLIERCLELNPSDRPTAADVCRHVFLAGDGKRSWRGYRGWEKVASEE